MDHIKLSNTLEKFVNENDLVSKLLAKFQNMNNIYTLKFDVEILSYISNVIENELNEHDAAREVRIALRSSLGAKQPYRKAGARKTAG